MNKIVNKFLLTGGKFISKLHPGQSVFAYSAWGSVTKHREKN